ncbi:hypothetical protein KIH31_14920 [Paenarthrobacter sp. DKR-5]|uniref:hypothetical protein n=1 Tax=Paenarthrobacter sp. DKR-5 TaxID=2835535 RepID=UPI001BDC4975|nr:hypothetical protein [Paenarthrobacter sp. DKR-5]MBT1003888.1 hypothetical protein [Paenarthrobacter sp. DKR-5]
MHTARARAVAWALLGVPVALLILDLAGPTSPVMVLFTTLGVVVQLRVWTTFLRSSPMTPAGDAAPRPD